MATSFAPFELQTVAAIPERHTAKWLNVVAHLDPRYGGISAVLPSFCEAIARTGRIDASLAAFCAPDEHFEMPNSIEVRRYPLGNTKWRGGDEVCRALERQIDRSAGIHIHGLWKEHCAAAAQLARKAGKPYLISAHGMLDPWALRQKRWKKLLYSILVERRNLEGARCLHALTEREAENYRRFQLSNPIVVVPHGVALPASTNPAAFFREHPELAGKRIVLFLGSLHFKKGLDLLCRAWKSANRPADAQLVLAGPDFAGIEAKLKAIVKELGVANSVTFAGMLRRERKWNALAAAEVFVLPSRSEGLSVSVLEALGMGIPAIATSRCNVPEVRTRECGWLIEPDEHELTRALNECFESSAGNRFMMGLNGRRTVQDTYNWRIIGRQMSAVYEWLAGGGNTPDVDIRFASRARTS